MDKRILVREGCKYLKYELQVPIYDKPSLLNMRNIYFIGGELEGSKRCILWEKTNTVFGKLNRHMKTYYSIS